MAGIGTIALSNLQGTAGASANKSVAAATNTGTDFKDILNNALEKFETIGDENAQTTLDLLTGSTDDLSNTMITAQKAEIAVNLTVAIKNKAIDAYKEIMNMQV